MLRSMTGYGEYEEDTGDGKIRVEVQSLNSRFLEAQVFTPPELESLEPLLRQLIQKKVKRGRVRLKVQVDTHALPVPFDFERARRVLQQFEQELSDLSRIQLTVDLANLLKLQEFRRTRELPAALRDRLLRAVRRALDRLVQARREEGAKLQEQIEKLLRRIEHRMKRIASLKKREIQEKREKTRQELEASLEEVDPDFLAHQLLSVSNRLDISEELQRLESHLERFRKILQGRAPSGRHLEFLAQEIHREVTTISQKSSSPKIVELTIEIREDVEKLKEQLRNVE